MKDPKILSAIITRDKEEPFVPGEQVNEAITLTIRIEESELSNHEIIRKALDGNLNMSSVEITPT